MWYHFREIEIVAVTQHNIYSISESGLMISFTRHLHQKIDVLATSETVPEIRQKLIVD